jgi:hypothetical protein
MQSATNSDSEMHPTNLKGISFYPNPPGFQNILQAATGFEPAYNGFKNIP